MLPAAEQAWKISVVRYRVGKIELAMTLDSWRARLEAKKQLASAQTERELILASLEKIIGVSIQDVSHEN